MNPKLPARPGFVPVPNQLFDVVLPTLTDTEARVLLVVIRSTLGWREGNEEGGTRTKQRDWIAHRQMVKRTGRSGSSVSAAIQSLIVRKLIAVEDAEGKPLASARERSANMGRLYFRLGEAVEMWKTVRFSDMGNVGSTTYSSNNKQLPTRYSAPQTRPQRARAGFVPAYSGLAAQAPRKCPYSALNRAVRGGTVLGRETAKKNPKGTCTPR
jgi:hypothetical protein